MSEDEFPGRVFTLEEASAVLDDLRERIPRLREARRDLVRSAEQVETSAPTNGGGSEGRSYWETLKVLREDLEYFASRDIVLRDAETGLVDFPAEIEGKPAFLCWRLGEEEIGFWHDDQTGFSGRKPLGRL